MQTNRPLTSIEAFVVALVEASSNFTVATPRIGVECADGSFDAAHDALFATD